MSVFLPDMAAVRATIDAVDDQLVELLAKRLHAIRSAAEIKQNPADSLVEWRVEQVASRVAKRAGEVGFDPDLAETIWRGMMVHCIEFERKTIETRLKDSCRTPTIELPENSP